MYYITRPAWLLKAGDYPDKNFTATVADLRNVADRQNAEPPTVIWNMHQPPVADFGFVDEFVVEGEWLKGTAHINEQITSLLLTKKLSLGIGLTRLSDDTRHPERIFEVSLVDNPRVEGAAIMSQGEATDTVEVVSELGVDMNDEKKENPITELIQSATAFFKGEQKAEKNDENLTAEIDKRANEVMEQLKNAQAELAKERIKALKANVALLNEKYSTVPPGIRDKLTALLTALPQDIELSEGVTLQSELIAILEACSKETLFTESLEDKGEDVSQSDEDRAQRLSITPEALKELRKNYTFIKE